MDGGGDVGVGVHRLRDTRMSEDLLNNLGVFALLEHEGGEGVPEIVEAHSFGHARLLQERLKVSLNEALPTCKMPGAGELDILS